MAGYGSLGGLGGGGGFGASYPSRGGVAPLSQRVDTPDELRYLHQKRLEGLQGVNVNRQAARQAYGQFANAYGGIADQAGLSPVMSADAFISAANNGGTYTANGQTFNLGNWISPIADGLRGAVSGQVGQWEEELAQNLASMEENSNRQQQAYDQMRGGNQLNGILGANYTQPNFGQISGTPAPGLPAEALGAGQPDVFQPGDVYTAPRPNTRGWGFR